MMTEALSNSQTEVIDPEQKTNARNATTAKIILTARTHLPPIQYERMSVTEQRTSAN